VCDYKNKNVFFTDASGGILHTSSLCKDPCHAVHTSWGHVVVADYNGGEVRVFSEKGEFLGNVQDSDGRIAYPQYLCLDETERRMYVGCGPTGSMEVRTYQFAASDLPPLPVTRTVRKLEMSANLATL
jgi:6-phosphogluconolactonase (cycloisomerase 2 family)